MALVGDLSKTVRSFCIEWRFKKNLLSSGRYLKSQSFALNKKYFYLTIPPHNDERNREIVLESDNFRPYSESYIRECENDYDDYSNPILKKDALSILVSCYISVGEDTPISLLVTEDKSILPHFLYHESMLIGSFDMQALSDFTLTVLLTVKIEDEDNGANENYPKSESTLVKNLEDLFLSEQEADILIKVKGIHFKSHRPILAARSEVFAAMLRNEMSEKQTGEVVINDCDPDCFKIFLLYLYTEKSDLITADNAMGLYYLASKYVVEELKKFCTCCLMKNLSTKLICDVLLFATTYNESDLLRAAKIFFCENADRIVLTTEWTNFQTANSALSNDLLAKSFIILKSNSNPLPPCIGNSSVENTRPELWFDSLQLRIPYGAMSADVEPGTLERPRAISPYVQPRSQRQRETYIGVQPSFHLHRGRTPTPSIRAAGPRPVARPPAALGFPSS